jgi:hypothetical protein
MGYCHCRSCRSWSGGPVNASTLWKPDRVRVTAGLEHVGMYQKTRVSQRQYCKKCGGHLMTTHPPFGLVDVFAATLPTLTFNPGLHVNYAETVLPMRDGLPKFRIFQPSSADRPSRSPSRRKVRFRSIAWSRVRSGHVRCSPCKPTFACAAISETKGQERPTAVHKKRLNFSDHS